MRRITSTVLALAILAPAPAKAEFRFHPDLVTVGLGPAMLQDGIGTTFFLAGRVDLGMFTDRLVWDAGLHWWRKSETTSYTFFGQTSETETSFRDLAMSSGVKFLIPVQSERWIPYARGGLALNFVDVSVTSWTNGVPAGTVSGGDTDLGMYLGGGASYRYRTSVLFGIDAALNVTDADHFLLGLTASFPFGGGDPE